MFHQFQLILWFLLALLVIASAYSNEESKEIDDEFNPVYVVPTPANSPRVKKPKKEGACSNERLRKTIHENMSDSTSDSKRDVHTAVSTAGGSWAVVCAECAFSYLAHTQEYCIHSRYDITCLVFRDG